MHIDPWILSCSLVTVVVTVFMGFWSARKAKTASDFFVAGRSVSVGWNASAISGEYLSAASFMGIAGMVMSSGYDALWYPVCYACGYLFLLLFIAGPLRRFGAYTIPDFAEGRFDSPLFRKIAVIFVLFIGFFYTMPQMKGAGTTLAYIFPGLPYWAGVVLVGAVITVNVALGGMKGITLVQAFQYWAKMFAISVPVFVLMSVYGHYGKQLGLNTSHAVPTASNSLSTPTAQNFPFLEQRWELASVNGNSNALYLKYAETKESIQRDIGKRSYPMGDLSLVSTIHMLAEQHGFHRILSESSAAPAVNLKTIYFLPLFSQQEWEAAARAGLRSNGVDVIVGSTALVVVPAAKYADYETQFKQQGMAAFEPSLARKPLPEKAPKDDAWIAPFGPLTTKAIKATAAANPTPVDWSKRDLLYEPDPTVRNVPMWARFVERVFKHRKPPQKPSEATKGNYNTPPDGRPLSEICQVMKHWAGIPDMLCASSIATKSIVIRQTTNFVSPKELVARMEQELEEQGITVLHASPEEWWAVSSADVKSYIKPIDSKPYALLYTYSLIIALVCGTAGLPHILVRFYTNPDGVAAKRTTMWVMILIGIFYVFPPVFGVIGRNLFPDLYIGTGAKGTDKIVLELPRILNERVPMLGSILSGIACAGAFAAFMSTFSGLLVSMTGAMAHDVYGRILRPKSTPEERMRAFKIAAFGIGAVALLLGMQVEALEINFMVGQAFAIAAASYFPLLFMAIWWRGLTMKGAATGMLTGGMLALLGISLTSFSSLATAPNASAFFKMFAGLNPFWLEHPLLRILCEQPAIWAVPLAIILMIVVSKLTRTSVPSDIRMKMLVLHAPEKLGLKQEYIQDQHAVH